jgi:O-antigen/teichoic acid export membrane protein
MVQLDIRGGTHVETETSQTRFRGQLMNSSKRIAVNTMATYGRSVLSAGLALFSGRWVLGALGQSDYGLYSVVGSVIIFLVFLNTVMAASASRFFSFSLGKGDTEEVNHWFNAAVSIHLLFALALVSIGWPIGETMVRHVLTISADRMETCVWVFRISLLSAMASMVAVPFVAMFTAKQHITELAFWGILQSVLSFTLASRLSHIGSDRLLAYSMGMVSILVIIQCTQIARALIVFPECKIVLQRWFAASRFKQIASFASWSLIGSAGSLLRDEGSAILLNIFFGPRVNAAYGIATQVSMQTNQLSSAMIGAFSPEITASEGRGDRSRMLSLSMKASKYGTLLVLLFALPLLLEMDFVMKLWLRDPPLHAATFCRLILVTFLIDRLSTGFMLAVNAHGKIAGYQATVGTCLVLTLPIAWLFLKMGLSPTSVGYAFVITMTGTSLGRVFWANRLFEIPSKQWLIHVLKPVSLVSAISITSGIIPALFMPESILRFTAVASASISMTLLSIWFLVTTVEEQNFIKSSIHNLKNKVFPEGSR